MAIITIGRMAEEIKKILDGGDSPLASAVSHNEVKIAIGQVVNQLLKTEYFSILKDNERIPDGLAIALYEGITVSKYNTKSQCTLPVKPQRLPRNMGIWSIFPSRSNSLAVLKVLNPDVEFIPLQMGQSSLLKSQLMINDLLGQVGYENFGLQVVFTKDITIPNETVTVDMRLVIMDVSQYGDYDVLPVLPEHEFIIKQTVVEMYSKEPIPDKIVDSAVKEQKNVPIKDQTQR